MGRNVEQLSSTALARSQKRLRQSSTIKLFAALEQARGRIFSKIHHILFPLLFAPSRLRVRLFEGYGPAIAQPFTTETVVPRWARNVEQLSPTAVARSQKRLRQSSTIKLAPFAQARSQPGSFARSTTLLCVYAPSREVRAVTTVC